MNTDRFSKVSIVIPVMNEESTLRSVLQDLYDAIGTLKEYTFEVIVVDDHSADRTREVAEEFDVRMIDNHRKSGKGNALISGFEQATGEAIVMLDGDCSHRPEDLPIFLALLQKERVGLVVGSRVTGGSEEYTLVRAFGNIFLTVSLNLAIGMFITDALNGFKAFRRDVFRNYSYKSRTFEIEIELVVNAIKEGYKISEFPSHERCRAGGEMKSRVIKHGFKIFWKIFTMGLSYRFARLRARFSN